MMKLYERAPEGRGKLLILTLFKTGGRVSEVLSLSKEDIDLSLSQHSAIVKIKVLKKEAGLMRSIPVLKAEPLSNEWLQLLETLKTYRQHYLFTAWGRHKPMDRRTAYTSVRQIGEDAGVRVSDHWFRGMRASQLVDDYQFEPYDLRQFFKWTRKKEDMAERYASMSWRGLERRMIESRPAEWSL